MKIRRPRRDLYLYLLFLQRQGEAVTAPEVYPMAAKRPRQSAGAFMYLNHRKADVRAFMSLITGSRCKGVSVPLVTGSSCKPSRLLNHNP
jgi:hypothetical protein